MVPREAASGEGCIDTAPSTGRLRFRLRVNNKPQKVLYQKKNESDAAFRRRAKKQRKQALAAGGQIVKMSIADVCEFYLERGCKDLTDAGRGNYETVIRKHIRDCTTFTALNADDVKPLQIESEYDWLMRNGRSTGVINKVHQLCKTSMRFAMRYELAHRNPFEPVDPPKTQKRERAYLAPQEIEKFLKAAENTDYYALMFVALSTGARSQELFTLVWQDIDLDKNTVIFRGTKTANAERMVIVNDKTVDILRGIRNDKIAGLVFTRPDGTELDRLVVWRAIRKISKAAGIDKNITMHSLRHTAAFVALATLRENTILERFGWSEMPETYKHWQAEAQLAEVEKIRGLI